MHLPIDMGDDTGLTLALLDCGAQSTLLRSDLRRRAGVLTEPLDPPIAFVMANGARQRCHAIAYVEGYTRAVTDFRRGQQSGQCVRLPAVKAYIVDELEYELLLGMDWLEAVDPHISFRSRKCIIDNHAARVTPLGLATDNMGEHARVQDARICAGKMDTPEESTDKRILALVARFSKVFEKQQQLPPSRGKWDFVIEFNGAAKPYHRSPRRYSPRELAAMQTEIDRLAKLNWIVRSHSPWGCPILFAKNEKKDGELRAVYDLRELNAQTIRMSYPIPRIPDLLDKLSHATVLSRLDLAKAFNQVRMAPSSQQYAAISSPLGLWESRVMLMGLKNSGPHFQALMDAVFTGNKSALPVGTVCSEQLEDLRPFLVIYLDDIVIATRTIEEHYAAIAKVLERLALFDLRCNEFYEFMRAETEFVGFMVGNGRIRPLQKKVEAILDYGEPKSAKDVRAFLGMIGYYREYIPNMANDAAALTKLTRRGMLFDFTEAQPHFENLKAKLARITELTLPDPTREYVIATDASSVGVGGVLMQPDNVGKLKPLAFYSRQMRGAELRYPIYEQELLAIKECLIHWRCYIDGVTVRVYTDHRPLVTGDVLRRHSEHHYSKRVAGWLERIWDLDVVLEYHSCNTDLAAVPDALSRRPDFTAAAEITHSINAIQHARPSEHEDLEKLRELKRSLVPKPAYVVSDGLWYYRSRLVIPEEAGELRTRILDAAHSSLVHGHRGMDSTLHHVARRFYWPSLTTDVRAFVRSCPSCARAKARTAKAPGLLHPLPLPDGPYLSLEMDFIVGLPKVDEYDAILTVVDRFTKRVFLAPTTTTCTSSELARIYMQNIWRHIGVPREIISDRGPQFISAFWKELLSELGITSKLSAAYHFRSHGQVERANRVAEEVLRSYGEMAATDWPRLLAAAEFAINSATSATTGMSPFRASYGVDIRAGTIVDTADEWVQLPNDDLNVSSWLERIREVRDALVERVNIAQQRQEAIFNTHRGSQTFVVGDKVFISTENMRGRNKLIDKYVGPFEIESVMERDTYKVKLPPQLARLTNTFHTSLLKPYYASPDRHATRQVDRPHPLPNDEGEYVIRKIVDVRGTGASKRYRVRWEGYGPEDDTWELSKTLSQVKDMITAFERARKTRSRT